MDTQFDGTQPGCFHEARSTEQEIRAQSQILAAQHFPDRLFDAVPSMFLLLNENRQVVFANQAVLNTLGLTEKQTVYGLRPGEALNCIYSKQSENGCGTSDFCSQCGANTVIRLSLSGIEGVRECNLLRQNTDGEIEALDLLVWATPFESEGQRYSAFSVMDVSHEKRRRALERIFFHDIMNIAGGIRTYTEFLAMESGVAGVEELTVIHNYASKLVDEIQAQRELSMAENNELTIRTVQFNPREFVEDTVSMYREHESAREKSLRIDSGSSKEPLVSDPILLGRVVGNMVKNALEATLPGGTVTAGCFASDGGTEFLVHNEGVIPTDAQKMIFKRSFSTKAADRGLGTYSLKLLTERYLGGKASFVSTAPEGTTFRVWLPQTPETAIIKAHGAIETAEKDAS